MHIFLFQNTYPFRKALKEKFGMRWDSQKKVWFKKNINLQESEYIMEFCEKNKISYRRSDGRKYTVLPPGSAYRPAHPFLKTVKLFVERWLPYTGGYRGFRK